MAEPSRRRRLTQLARIDVGELHTVGPRRRERLGVLGISSVLDLLTHYPTRYEDWTSRAPIAALAEGEAAVVLATVRRVSERRLRNGRSLVEMVVVDATGELRCSFFNQPWRARQLRAGMTVVLRGKVSRYRDRLQIAGPGLQIVDDGEVPEGRLVPVYRESEKAKVGSLALGRFVAEALRRAGEFDDPLPAEIRRRARLIGRTEAFRAIHAPERASDHLAARRRLAFDELFRLQVALVLRKRAAAASARGIAHLVGEDGLGPLVGAFVATLPFALTAAQRRVLEEIARDLASPLPMHRLLQGDVGAGKTVVALATLLFGVQGGHQGALMVPTEVLAEQHYLAALRLLDQLVIAAPDRLGGERPVRVELLTSRTPAGERQRIVAGLMRGEVDVLVGTHALITDDVAFHSLGVVVIDEQHRFGVDQRAALRQKGSTDAGALASDPDLLVMTATPIPRTAAMTVYGDLDASVLDELPAGRAPIVTRWVQEAAAEEEVWAAVRDEVAAGHQAFVVCPLVRPPGLDGESDVSLEEEADASADDELEAASDELDVEAGEPRRGVPRGAGERSSRRVGRAAVEEVERLRAGPLASCRVGLLHGQLPAREKEQTMAAFRAGAIDVLVATTVIEVGVDVEQATVMVVEDADRFGIAQLHQLRGRVGRSNLPSRCFLLAPEAQGRAAQRLAALEQTDDGFLLAEVDLDLRGEGTVLGTRQVGRNELRLASLRRDRELVAEARQIAQGLVDGDPLLEANPVLADELRLFIGEEEAEYLQRS